MRPVVLLSELNDLDVAVDAKMSRLAEIAEALKEPAALRAARQAVAAGEAELARCRAAQSAAERAQQDCARKVSAAESDLYGGKVRDSRELSSRQADVEQLKRQCARSEDALLEAMLATDTATARLEEARSILEGMLKEREQAVAGLQAEQARIRSGLPALQARQAAARKAAPASLLPLYDSLRARRAGRAVAQLDGDTCSVCSVAASPTKVEAARYGEEMVFCDNCGRLLWGE